MLGGSGAAEHLKACFHREITTQVSLTALCPKRDLYPKDLTQKTDPMCPLLSLTGMHS